MYTAVFIVAAALILVGALGVVLGRQPVHSALFLIQTLMGVAVLFIAQDAHFLAAVQVVVYAGAIVILFLFVIMLLGVDKVLALEIEPIAGQRPLAVIVAASVTAAVVTMVVATGDVLSGASASDPERMLDSGRSDVERLGRVLFSDHVFAFETTAALLTIAVVGAVVLTRRVGDGDLGDHDVDETEEPAPLDLPPVAPVGANDEEAS